MDARLFDYPLPPDRIAQQPAAQRDASRLLVVHRQTGRVEHRRFRDLPEYLGPDDLLLRNDAKTLPARLRGLRPTGGRVECLLLRPAEDDPAAWWCLLRPGRRLGEGAVFERAGAYRATVIAKGEEAQRLVRFELFGHPSVVRLAEAIGEPPLPPYIKRPGGRARPADKERYQTSYADPEKPVAAAAPTAGLHFTPALDQTLAAKGVQIRALALHVGLDTFKPLEKGPVERHRIHRELYELPAATREAVLDAPVQGRRRVCVGTTSTRALEDWLAKRSAGRLPDPRPGQPLVAEADLFLYPPCAFRATDALVTNFHFPRSTLLCLVSAFLAPGSEDGIAWLKELYAEALRREYRFLSYGDAMLIL